MDDLAAGRGRLERIVKMPEMGRGGNVAHRDLRTILAAYDAQAARLADIWLLVDLWDQGTEGSLETLERLAELKRDAGAAGEGRA